MKQIYSVMLKRWYIIIAVVIIALIVFSYFKNSKKAANIKDNPFTVKRQDLKENLSFAGSIDAEEKVTLQFQTGGQLAWVGVKEGDHVKKYQSIASLDTRVLKKTLDKYLNTFMTTRWNYDQSRQDNDPLTVTLSSDIRAKAQRLIDQSQFSLNNSVLDVELQNLALQYENIYTPIEGIVTKVDTPFPGVNVAQTQSQFEIINPNTMYFSATADQTEVTQLSQDQKGTITFDAFPEASKEASIYWIGYVPKAGETGTVYQIKTHFPFDGQKYRIGMTGDISFTTKERSQVLAVPANYVKKNAKDKSVYVEKKGIKGKENIPIQIGETIDGSTIITAGLQEGDIVYDKTQ